MLKDNERIDFSGVFSEIDFENHLEEIKQATRWVTVPVKSMRFRKLDESDMFATPSDSEKDTAMEGTGLFVKGEHLPCVGIRECAIPSIRRRLGLNCQAMDTVTATTAAEIMSDVAKESSDHATTLVGIVNGKVNAMLSTDAGKNSYQVFDSSDVFEASKEMVDEMVAAESTEPTEFVAQWGYDGFVARWKTPIKQELMGRKYKTIVDMETSDIGESSVKYGASLEVGGTRVPFMTEQRIEHRRKNSGLDVLEASEMVKASVTELGKNIPDAMKEGMSRLRTLEMITITNPVETMDAMSNLVGLPKRAYVPVIRKYSIIHGNKPTTALQLYLELSTVLDIYENRQRNFTNQNIVKGNLLKLLGADWARHDHYSADVRDRYR